MTKPDTPGNDQIVIFMVITIFGSIKFFPEMLESKARLEDFGHKVLIPPTKIESETGEMIPVLEYYRLRKTETNDESWIWKRKKEAMRDHFYKIESSDVILVLNYDRKGIPGYVGANTFLEMGLAFYLKKPIYLLNDIPDVDFKEEILGMFPTVIKGDLSRII